MDITVITGEVGTMMNQVSGPMPDVRVDQMCKRDLDEVIRLGESAPEFKTGTDAAQFYSRATLERWLEEATGIALVSRAGGKVVGFVLAQYMPASRDGYLNAIVVEGRLQGTGIADDLLERALTLLERRGCNHVFGSVQDANGRALRFFDKHDLRAGGTFRYVEAMLPR